MQEASGEFVMSYLFKLGSSQMFIVLLSMPFLFAHLPYFLIKTNFKERFRIV